MRFRTFALSVSATLGVAALAAAGYEGADTLRRRDEVKQARAVVDFVDPSLKFIEALSLERAEYLVALTGPPSALAEELKALGERTQVTDARLAQARARAAALPESVRGPAEAALDNAKNMLLGARLDADPLIDRGAVPASVAAETLHQRYEAADAEVDRALDRAEQRLVEIDLWSNLHVELLRLDDNFRDLAGQRSEILTAFAASGRPLSGDEADRATEIAGAMDVTWRRLQNIAEQIGSPPVAAGLQTLKTEFFSVAEPIYQAMLNSARVGYPPPPMDAEAWRRWDEDKLAAALALRDPTIAELARRLDAMGDEANRAATWGLAGGALALALMVLIGLLIERRVLRPLQALTVALDGIVAHKGDAETLAAPAQALAERFALRDDEIGSLARAMLGLRDHARQLSDSNARFDALIGNLPQGVSLYDGANRLVIANRRFAEIYGLPSVETAIGRRADEIAALSAERGVSPTPNMDAQLLAQFGRDGDMRIAACIVDLRNGRTVSANGLKMPGGGWLSTHLDITERRRAEERIAYMAEHDALTGLANRSLFVRHLENAAARAQRGQPIAVMCLDLDRFKAVNDVLGHACGDELLRQVAERLCASLRSTDHIARFGGDEFVVLADGEGAGIAQVAERLITRLSEPYDLDGQRAEISASIGIALGPADGQTPRDLLRAADLAMYRAKSDGRNAFRFFEPEMDVKMQLRRALERDMRAALGNDEFELHYQPIIEADGGRVASCEALLRWRHPTRGRISPADFIPLAEDSGLIVDIGAWALRQACSEAMNWPREVKVSVNLSPRQFVGPRLLADIVGALDASGLPACRLELEITERVTLINSEPTLAILGELRRLGVAIAMDDFGTGYSSLSYLRKFPFDKIKIDQAFVRDLTPQSDAVAIVRAVADLARALNMRTTAEGVETREQYDLLRREGCDQIQGYLISRPLGVAGIRAFLAEGRAKRKIA